MFPWDERVSALRPCVWGIDVHPEGCSMLDVTPMPMFHSVHTCVPASFGDGHDDGSGRVLAPRNNRPMETQGIVRKIMLPFNSQWAICVEELAASAIPHCTSFGNVQRAVASQFSEEE